MASAGALVNHPVYPVPFAFFISCPARSTAASFGHACRRDSPYMKTMRNRAAALSAPFLAALCSTLLVGILADDSGVVVSPLLDAVAQPPFEFLRAPLSRNGIRVQGRAGGACTHNGKNHDDQEEWAHYTTSQTAKPYYGFKLKCQDGTVQVLGCYESEMLVAVDGKATSKAYDGFDILCSATGFKYERAAKSCKDHALGEVWNQGFYKYECTKDGIVIKACLDGEQKERPVDEVYTVLNAYRMKCIKKPDGKLVVEAIACIDEHGQIIDLNGKTRSPWYIRTCQEQRNPAGRQTEVALNLTHCCEATTEHCIPVDTREKSILFPELTFACIKRDKEFTYRYFGETGTEVTIDESALFSTTQNETTIDTTILTTETLPDTTEVETTLAATVAETPLQTTEAQKSTPAETLPTTEQTDADTAPPATVALSTAAATLLPTTEQATPMLTEPTITNTQPTETENDQSAATITVTEETVEAPEENTPEDEATTMAEPPLTAPPWPPKPAPTEEMIETAGPDFTEPNNPTRPRPPKPVPADETDETAGPDFTEPNNPTRPRPPRPKPTDETDETADPDFTEPDNPPTRPAPSRKPQNPDREDFPTPTTEQPWNKWDGPNKGRPDPERPDPDADPTDDMGHVVTQPDRFPNKPRPNQGPDDRPQQPNNPEQNPWNPRPDDNQQPPQQPEPDHRPPPNRPDNPWWQPDPTRRPNQRPDPNIDQNPWQPKPGDNQPPPTQPNTDNRPGNRPDNPWWPPAATNGPDNRPNPNDRPRPDQNPDTETGPGPRPNPDQPNELPQEPRPIPDKEPGPNRPGTDTGNPPADNGPQRPNPRPEENIDGPDDNNQKPDDTRPSNGGNRPTNGQPNEEHCIAQRECPPKWTRKGNHCYYFAGVRQRRSVERAEETCLRENGHLLLLNDNAEWNYLQDELNAIQHVYRGRAYDGFWVGYRYDEPTSQWHWDLKSDFSPIPWLNNKRRSAGGRKRRRRRQASKDVESLLRGCGDVRWDNANPTHWGMDNDHCQHRQWFICELCLADPDQQPQLPPKDVTEVERPPIGGNQLPPALPGVVNCREGWTEHNRHCYFLSKPNNRVTVDDAKQVCANHGAHLVVVNDQAEWDFIANQAEKQRDLQPDDSFDGFWIGLHLSAGSEQWQWDKESNFNNIPWLVENRNRQKRQTAQTAQFGKGLTCGEIRYDLQQWGADKDHCLHLQGYICEKGLSDDPNGDCRVWKNKCGSMAKCAISESGYRCICAVGYEDRGDGRCVDIDECRDPVKACGPNAHCQNDQGSHRCYCKMHYRRSRPTDNCTEFATCTTYGDPHYRGFDGSKLLYQGLCQTILVQSKSAEAGNFRVDSRAEIRDNIPGYSWTRDMFFSAFGRQIGLLKGGKVTVDGEPIVLPYQVENGRVEIKRSAQGHLLVQTDFGLEVSFDGDNRGEIHLDARHKRQVTGVCGNYNGDVRDDNRGPDGTDVNDPDRFGDSWRAPEDKDNPNCSPDRTNEPTAPLQRDPCESGSPGYIRAEQFCQPLQSAAGPFHECYQFLGMDSTNHFRSCVIDVCGTGPKAMCAEFENVAGQCAERGIRVIGWRAKLGCSPKSCAENQEYLTCGPSCPKSCADQLEQRKCPDQCVEGCFCKQGFVLSGDACVPENACGCIAGNTYIAVGQSYYKDDVCSQKCTCVQNKAGQPASLDCSSEECDYQAVCMRQGGTNPDDNNRKSCVDIDECFEMGQRACQDTLAECRNTPGSFRCSCPKGYMMKDGATARRLARSVDGSLCEDVDECAMKTHDCNLETSICRNTPGSYSCSCQAGFVNAGNAGCKRAATCTPGRAAGSNGCGGGSDCVVVNGETKCVCRGNYESDGVTCKVVDQCADPKTNPCDERNSKCVSTGGAVECVCAVGFRTVDRIHCQDENECSSGACGANADCLNTYGSYLCRCLPGFMRKGDLCEDVNECLAPELQRCDRSAVCKNSYGAYSCQCMQGYTGNGYSCTAFDPCETCHDGGGGCDRNARCYPDQAAMRGFRCVCNPGYTGNGFTCQDVNECQQLRARCAEGTTCVNTQGSYHCECQDEGGLWVVADTVDRCRQPITDPCEDTDKPVCDKSATCESKGDLYRCHCAKGFTGDGKPKNCKDIDECKTGTEKICGANAICHNTQGSYWCECKLGYMKPNARLACADIDECKDESLNKCDRQADCINIEGSYNCQCKKGFKGDGKVCKRSDACASKRKLCDQNAECTDSLDAGTMCRCRPGFTGDGFSCHDIDECADLQTASLCGRESKCVNTPGSFKCECNVGFKRLNANACDDIDECLTECKGAAMDCKNTYGSFMCLCKEGYRLTDPEESAEKVCVDVDDCFEACRNGKCKTGNSNPLCPIGTICADKVGGVECRCNEDLKKTDVSCEQIDECASGKHNCNGPHMTCLDTPAGFQCQCADGYSFARGMGEPICVDTDECSRPNNCSLHARCTNSPGSYSCTCRPGFTGDGFNCIDVNECDGEMTRRKRQVSKQIGVCHDGAICSNTLGSFVCTCVGGFIGDGSASCSIALLLISLSDSRATSETGPTRVAVWIDPNCRIVASSFGRFCIRFQSAEFTAVVRSCKMATNDRRFTSATAKSTAQRKDCIDDSVVIPPGDLRHCSAMVRRPSNVPMSH
uniref:Uncharacterized protein n=1 Tax=Plectus sambesii TaxID=2011161 RepID=A0A914W495_9BILA